LLVHGPERDGEVKKPTATANCRDGVGSAVTDRKLTLFEIHLDDATFTANATATEGSEAALPDEAAADDDEETGGCLARRAGTALLALALLAALAVAAAKLLGGGALDEELDDLADLDEA
jgi:hypothetical protein